MAGRLRSRLRRVLELRNKVKAIEGEFKGLMPGVFQSVSSDVYRRYLEGDPEKTNGAAWVQVEPEFVGLDDALTALSDNIVARLRASGVTVEQYEDDAGNSFCKCSGRATKPVAEDEADEEGDLDEEDE